MKKLLIIVLSVFMGTCIFAQKKYEVGVKGGLNITTQTTKGSAKMLTRIIRLDIMPVFLETSSSTRKWPDNWKL